MQSKNRFGNFMMGFIPLLSALGMQFIVVIPMTGIALLYAVTSNAGKASGNPMEYYMELVSTNSFSTWSCILYALACIAIFGFWYYKCFAKTFGKPIKQAFHPLMIPALILAAVAWQYLAQYIALLTATVSPGSLEYYESLLETAGFDEITLLLIIYTVVLGPICEELLFRGVTLSFAKRALPFWLANIFQAVLFGVFHLNVMQGVYAFFLGLVMGLICEKCRNIIFSMIFHMLYNAWTTFIPAILMYRYDEMPFLVIWLAVGIVLAILSGLLFALSIRKREQSATASAKLQDQVNFSS